MSRLFHFGQLVYQTKRPYSQYRVTNPSNQFIGMVMEHDPKTPHLIRLLCIHTADAGRGNSLLSRPSDYYDEALYMLFHPDFSLYTPIGGSSEVMVELGFYSFKVFTIEAFDLELLPSFDSKEFPFQLDSYMAPRFPYFERAYRENFRPSFTPIISSPHILL